MFIANPKLVFQTLPSQSRGVQLQASARPPWLGPIGEEQAESCVALAGLTFGMRPRCMSCMP